MSFVRSVLPIVFGASGANAIAAVPVKRIDLHVMPYHEAAKTPDGTASVAVGKANVVETKATRRQDDADIMFCWK